MGKARTEARWAGVAMPADQAMCVPGAGRAWFADLLGRYTFTREAGFGSWGKL